MSTPDFRYPHRVTGLRELIATPRKVGETTIEPVDAVLITHLENARYLTGFSGSNALVLVTANEAIFFTDSRYGLQSATEVPGYERVVLGPAGKMSETMSETVKKLGIKTLAFEAAHVTYNAYEDLKKALPETVNFVPRTELVETLRQVKDADEIAAMRRAIALADECFTFMCATAKVGMTERELAWEMEVFMRSRGASKLSFESIVGSGPNSALIHGRPSDRKLGESGGPELLLCDYGCEVAGYCSDITRTFVVGGEPTADQRKLYDTVHKVQLATLEAIKPGVPGKDVDTLARSLFTEAGYGEAFSHGLGHGLGRVVHDHPALGQRSDVILKPGMVVTCEPGAYLEGFGGVRIEDDVLVTETGHEILTRSTKELLVIG
jgi:Xaa-Pro aminopeptidase